MVDDRRLLPRRPAPGQRRRRARERPADVPRRRHGRPARSAQADQLRPLPARLPRQGRLGPGVDASLAQQALPRAERERLPAAVRAADRPADRSTRRADALALQKLVSEARRRPPRRRLPARPPAHAGGRRPSPRRRRSPRRSCPRPVRRTSRSWEERRSRSSFPRRSAGTPSAGAARKQAIFAAGESGRAPARAARQPPLGGSTSWRRGEIPVSVRLSDLDRYSTRLESVARLIAAAIAAHRPADRLGDRRRDGAGKSVFRTDVSDAALVVYRRRDGGRRHVRRRASLAAGPPRRPPRPPARRLTVKAFERHSGPCSCVVIGSPLRPCCSGKPTSNDDPRLDQHLSRCRSGS